MSWDVGTAADFGTSAWFSLETEGAPSKLLLLGGFFRPAQGTVIGLTRGVAEGDSISKPSVSTLGRHVNPPESL